jgi:cytochrome c oxidase assembly factor CtaG
MAGVCMMAISLIKLLPRHGWTDLFDEVLALAGVVFLVSVALSFASLRRREQAAKLERWAENVFLCGLVSVIVAAIGLAYGMT